MKRMDFDLTIYDLNEESKKIILAAYFFQTNVNNIYGQRSIILDSFNPETFYRHFKIYGVDNTKGKYGMMVRSRESNQ